jgi:hypothetical protein
MSVNGFFCLVRRRVILNEHEQSRELFHPLYFSDEVNNKGLEATTSRIEYLKEKMMLTI